MIDSGCKRARCYSSRLQNIEVGSKEGAVKKHATVPSGLTTSFVRLMIGRYRAFIFTILLGLFNHKKAQVIPINKKGCKHDVGNYRPISVVSTFSKLFETLIIPD